MNQSLLANSNNNASGPEPVGAMISVLYPEYFFVPVLFVFGVVGNVITIRVMASPAYRNMPVSKLLMALSLSDILVNVLVLFNQPFSRGQFGLDVLASSSAGCVVFFWAYRFSRLTSSWMVVMISCERFVAVWLHIKAKAINNTTNAYIAIGLVYGIFAVYAGYLGWCADRIVNGTCFMNIFNPETVHLARAFLATSLITYNVLPSAMLVVINALIVYKLVKMNKARNRITVGSSSSGQQLPGATSSRNRKTTVMLLSVTLAFVILVSPNAVTHLVSFVKRENVFSATDRATVLLREISQLCEQLDHSINFLLYVLSSKTFREDVLVLLKCGRVPSSGPRSTTND